MNKIIYIILIIIILIGGTMFIFNKKDKNVENQSTIKYVSMDEIVQIMNENENYIILDVRTFEEYNEGHIPNAICIPNETIGEDIISKLPNKEQLILIYCRSGNRSKQAAKKLNNLRYTNLVEFGGIIDWKGEIVK
jgi:rhodanese-related sulfurtransferase